MFTANQERLRWLNDALLRPPDDAAETTGPFGKLPPELLDMVARKLLECRPGQLRADAAEAARAFARFVQLSRAFGVVSTSLRLEAACIGRCARPDFSVPELPFYQQVRCELEQELVSRSLLLCLRLGLLAGDGWTCNASRVLCQNREWRLFDKGVWAPIVRKVVGERVMKLRMAWGRGGVLLGGGDEVALVGTEEGLLAISSAPSKTLTPETELRVVYSRPGVVPSKAACRGSLLAFGYATGAHSYVLETWDTGRDVRVDVREEEGILDELWFSPGGVLHRLATSWHVNGLPQHGQVCRDAAVWLRRSKGADHNLRPHFIVGRQNNICLAHCAETSAVVVLHSHPNHGYGMALCWTQNLWQEWPSRDRCGCCLDASALSGHIDDYETVNPGRDVVDLSPRGDRLIVCGRGHVVPAFKIYAQNDAGEWALGAEVDIGIACGCRFLGADVAIAQAHGTWSSCGSMYAVVMETIHTGLLMFEATESLRTGFVASKFWRTHSSFLPTKLLWCKDGLWAQSNAGAGAILRLGFCGAL